MARIFVGIPTLDRPHFLREAVESVTAQSFSDWRILVSDNASRPEASEKAQAFIEDLADPRIGYHRQPKNIREYGNCEWLSRQCDEEYFVVLHDDDLLEPDHLDTALSRLEANPRLACFFSNAKLVDTSGRVSPERTQAYRRARGRDGVLTGPVRILEPLMRTGFVPISGTVMRTSASREAGFVDADCFGLWPFELNMLMRLGEGGREGWFEQRELVRYRFHEGQMQRYQGIAADPVALSMALRILERRRYDGEAERLRRYLVSMFHHLQARIAVRAGDLASCRRSLWRALRANPWWARHWPLAACAFLMPPLTRELVRRIDARPPREL